jgi:hypothetical protein
MVFDDQINKLPCGGCSVHFITHEAEQASESPGIQSCWPGLLDGAARPSNR